VVERRALYADFQGRRTTFSSFMRETAARLTRTYPSDGVWVTIRGLFREYPNMDVGTRISIVKRAEDLLNNIHGALADAGQIENDQRGQSPAGPQALNAGASPQRRFSPVEKVPIAEVTREQKTAAPFNKEPVRFEAKPQTASSVVTIKPAVSSLDPHSTEVQYVKGVGPKLAEILKQLGVETVEDLLRHYPRRHLDFQNRLRIADLQLGQEVTILGQIRSVGAFQSPRRAISIITIVITDGSGSITVTKFIGGKSNRFLLERYKSQFPKDSQVIASGIVERDKQSRRFALKNAEIELLGFGTETDAHDESLDAQSPAVQSIHTGRLVPVYALTEGLSLRHLRTIIYNALTSYGANLKDALPESTRQQHNLTGLTEAISGIHFPESPEVIDKARRRLVFDELFAIQLQLAVRRHKFDQSESALSLIQKEDGLVQQLKALLPFKLTGAQERVFQEIARDLASSKPMHRLVQGDVGSGKTVVALMAALTAIDHGFQVAIMAPTEILAEQHFRQFQTYLTPLGLRAAAVLGKQGQRERKQIRQELLSGQVHIAVGTHALLEEDVEFSNLGLVIIDEQHRFGVQQRARLKSKSVSPELLTMTATPIPRTLALTMHGDLDVSEIDELPPGRKAIKTYLFTASQRNELWQKVREEVVRGRQIYIVFPLIEESETLAAKAATQEYEKLKSVTFPELRIALMHGKLKPQEKEEVMEAFRDHKYDILVSTTVIEVGVDVPNASMMVIENADRFGLAQLHQLRGRVGRGSDQSYCYLVADNRSPMTRQRLEILTQTNDGFVVATKDLEIRGPGEFLGYRQSGLPDLLLTDLVNDVKILEEARNAALEIVKQDPELTNYPLLQELLASKQESGQGEVLRSG
jgi:ATP-dependent DNA helicase RecG